MFTSGDITEVVGVHPSLGTLRLEVKANESGTLDRGGVRNDDSEDGVTGAGSIILKKSRVRWSFEIPVAINFLGDNELSTLNLFAASPDPATWTTSHISGAVWKMQGWPVGDMKPDTNTAQMKLKLAGGGQMEQIA